MYQPRLVGAVREDILTVARKIAAQHPDAFAEVKVPGQRSRRFIALVARECQRVVHPEIGCNLKRGGPAVSIDVLAFPNSTGCRDASYKFQGLELVDIGAGFEGPNASIGWNDVTQATIDADVSGGWISPDDVDMGADSNAGNTGNVPASRALEFPPRDLVGAFFHALNQKYKGAGRGDRGDGLYVDNEGLFVWVSEFLRRYATGDHAPAVNTPTDRALAVSAAVMADVDKVWGK